MWEIFLLRVKNEINKKLFEHFLNKYFKKLFKKYFHYKIKLLSKGVEGFLEDVKFEIREVIECEGGKIKFKKKREYWKKN
uniref:Uncharacterized protein n=1 Tax=Meloidogyne enterolobii TaxID=390850 RepID=A0A6V7TK63_MELEN|nr:unnamed protein product [Meloidogyne enterolobii]